MSEESNVKDSHSYNERSLVSFPYSDLDASIEVARGVHTAGGNACEVEQLAAALNMEAKGGGFRTRLNSAQTFDLVINERGGRVKLTDTGRLVLDPATERQARCTAFLAVELFSKTYDEFKGGQLPPQSGLESAIVRMGVGSKVKDRARQVLLRSAKQAGFFEFGADRLVKPTINGATSGQPAKPPQEEDNDAESPPLADQPKNLGKLHPLIQGLFQTLPVAASKWSNRERANWLNMANSIFKMIYTAEDDDTGELQIRQKGETTM